MNNNDERDYEEENFNRALMEEEMDDYLDYTTLDDYAVPREYYSPGYFEFIDDHYGWDY